MSRHVERAYHYRAMKMDALAIESFDLAIAEHGQNAVLLGARAGCFAKVGRFDEALRDFPIALAEAPDAVGGWINYAFVLESVGEFDKALTALDKAIELEPTNARALYNKGICLEREYGRLGEGIPYFDAALKNDPAFDEARSGYSFVHLKSGDWAQGWKEFEYRGLGGGQRIQLPGLLWNGQQTTDELILTGEQGLGDQIQFARFAKVAAYNKQPTALFVDRNLHKLFGTMGSGIRLIGDASEIREPYQWLPMMSMALMMGTTPTTIPLSKRYLKADTRLTEIWADTLAPWKDNFKIGICWHPGSLWRPHTRPRAIPLQQFAEIAAIPNVQLISLQKGGSEKEVAEIDFKVYDLNHDYLQDGNMFADCAAIIENLDLVISTDTSVLHLAGALGKKTLVALPVGGCWRWMTADTTPWYADMKLYRQTEFNKWDDVFGRIAADVREMAHG